MIENLTYAAKAITRYAQENNIDFICIDTSSPGIFNQLIGTTASKLITECPIPVIVVPYTYRMSPINFSLYASDLAKLGVELPFVKNFAALFTASTQVYHYSTLFDRANFKSHFNTIAENYKSENVSFNFKKFNKQYSLLNHLEPDILRIKPSIIVMFTKKNRDRYQRHFHSNKTEKYGYDTNIPLLVFRK